MIEDNTHNHNTVNIWAGIVSTIITGSFIIDGNLTGNFSYKLLDCMIIPVIENIDGLTFNTVWFLQDGEPPYFPLQVS